MIVRPLEPGDDDAILRLFTDTLLLGNSLSFTLARLADYRWLCLGWYLTSGRDDAAVAVDDEGSVVGYALVCTNEHRYNRWTKITTLKFLGTSLGWLALGRIERQSLRFYTSRARDATTLATRRKAPPMPVHAHINLDRRRRTGAAALALRNHVDRRALLAGAPGWYGEMNTRRGERESALRRIGLAVTQRDENRTFTAAVGMPIDRLTVVRQLPDKTDAPRSEPSKRMRDPGRRSRFRRTGGHEPCRSGIDSPARSSFVR